MLWFESRKISGGMFNAFFNQFLVSYKSKRIEIFINVFYAMNTAKILKNEFNFWNVHGIMNI